MKAMIVKIIIGAAVMWVAIPLTVHGMPTAGECDEDCVSWEKIGDHYFDHQEAAV